MDPGPLASTLVRLSHADSSRGPTATMEEAQRLVAMMAAITALSLMLVVGLLITLLVVIWTARRRQSKLPDHCCCSSGRGCPNGGRYHQSAGPLGPPPYPHHEKQIKPPNYLVQNSSAMSQLPLHHRRGQQHQVPFLPQPGATAQSWVGSGASTMHPWMGSSHAGAPAFWIGETMASTQRPPVSSAQGRLVEGGVIVNPLAVPPLWGQTDAAGVTSRPGEGPHGGQQQQGAVMVTCNKEEKKEEGEPIYAEIRPPSNEKAEGKEVVMKNKLTAVEGSSKKGVEYWQITTKEMTKFVPCTQVAIRR